MKTLFNLSLSLIILFSISSCTKTDMKSSPVNAEVSSDAVKVQSILYIGTKTGFYCLNADNGKTRWHFSPGPGYQQVCSSTPTLNSGHVVFNMGDSLYALDMLTGAKAWASYSRHFRSALFFYGYRIYAGTPYGVACYNGDNGALIWFHKYAAVDALQNHNSSPIVINSVVYVGGGADNMLYALSADTGDEIWKTHIANSGANSSPTVYDSKVYMLGDSSLFVLNAANGNIVMQKQFNFKFSYQAPSIFFNGFKGLYIAADSFYCFNPDDASRKWAFGDASGASCTTDGFIDFDGIAAYPVFGNKFYKVNSQTGVPVAGWGNTGELFSDDMIVSNNKLFYRSNTTNTLYANSAVDDSPVWTKQFAGTYDGGSAITQNIDGSIILPMVSGNHY